MFRHLKLNIGNSVTFVASACPRATVSNTEINYEDLKSYSPAKDLLKNRVILVTGAGQGIGRAAALAYATHGATVILHGRNIKKLEGVYDEIEAAGGAQPAIFPLDLEKAEDKDFAGHRQAIKLAVGQARRDFA